MKDFHKIDKFCLNCGIKLKLKNSRDIERKNFCGRSCSLKYMHYTGIGKNPPIHKLEKHPNWKGGVSKVERHCSICGENIYYKSENNLCKTCFNKAKYKRIKFNCIICGKENELIPHRYNNLKYKVCSTSCMVEYRKINNIGYEKRRCPSCNKEFYRLKSQQTGELLFCSMSCSSKYYGITNREKLNFYIDGRTPLRKLIKNSSKYDEWRFAVYKSNGNKCVVCGKKTNLHAHHIKNFSDILKSFLKEYPMYNCKNDKVKLYSLSFDYEQFWDESNGLALCNECHSECHPEINLNLHKNMEVQNSFSA